MLTRLATVAVCLAFAMHANGAGAQSHVVIVARDGSGDFRTLQAAIDASGPDGAIIRIRPGTYEELIVVDKPKIQLRGLGDNPREVVLTWHLSSGTAGGTFKSASTTVTGDDFYAENLTFELLQPFAPAYDRFASRCVAGHRRPRGLPARPLPGPPGHALRYHLGLYGGTGDVPARAPVLR